MSFREGFQNGLAGFAYMQDQQDRKREQGMQDEVFQAKRKQMQVTELSQMARYLANIPAQARPQVYASLRPKLDPIAQSLGLPPAPPVWSEDHLPELQQLAQWGEQVNGSDVPSQQRYAQWLLSQVPAQDRDQALGVLAGTRARPATGGISFGELEDASGRTRMTRKNPRTGVAEVLGDQGWEPVGGGVQPQGGAGFDSALSQVFQNEGGYVGNDGGAGPTNMGINSRANPDVDVKNLTKEQAAAIYKQRYWDAIGADNLPPELQMQAFDTAVNMGVDVARELLRQSDGDPEAFAELRKNRYRKLIASNPAKYGQFAESWNRRVDTSKYASRTPEQTTAANEQAKVDVQIANTGRVAQSEAEVAAAKARAEARAKVDVEKEVGLPQAIANGGAALKLINSMLLHPGRKAATGLSAATDPMVKVPGSPGYDFNVKAAQLKGKVFLEAFQSLKGAGQITEVEGQKATDAIAALDTAQSERQYADALRDLADVIRGSLNRAQVAAHRKPTFRTLPRNSSGGVDDLLSKYGVK